MKILSLFDGISGLQVALNNIGIKNYEYYASELDKYAIAVTQKNFPNTIQLGDVKNIIYAGRDNFGLLQYKNQCNTKCIKDIEGKIEIMCFGFPCQSFSIAGKQGGFSDDRGQLFFEALRILKEVKPRFFIAENVASMKKPIQEEISQHLFGITPTL